MKEHSCVAERGHDMDTQESLIRQSSGVATPTDHANSLVATLKWLLADTIPSTGRYWQVTCHVECNEEGCTDIHVHTCTRRHEDKQPSQDTPPPGGYL
jgi:hypothetical protein